MRRVSSCRLAFLLQLLTPLFSPDLKAANKRAGEQADGGDFSRLRPLLCSTNAVCTLCSRHQQVYPSPLLPCRSDPLGAVDTFKRTTDTMMTVWKLPSGRSTCSTLQAGTPLTWLRTLQLRAGSTRVRCFSLSLRGVADPLTPFAGNFYTPSALFRCDDRLQLLTFPTCLPPLR